MKEQDQKDYLEKYKKDKEKGVPFFPDIVVQTLRHVRLQLSSAGFLDDQSVHVAMVVCELHCASVSAGVVARH